MWTGVLLGGKRAQKGEWHPETLSELGLSRARLSAEQSGHRLFSEDEPRLS